MSVVLLQLSVKVARAAQSRGVHPAREGVPRETRGQGGRVQTRGLEDKRSEPALLTRGPWEAPAGSGGEACSQGGAEAAEGRCGRP